jgi:hypothetical protein
MRGRKPAGVCHACIVGKMQYGNCIALTMKTLKPQYKKLQALYKTGDNRQKSTTKKRNTI